MPTSVSSRLLNPRSWPLSLRASFVSHALIGLWLSYYVRVIVVLQTLDMSEEGVATPGRTLAWALAAAVVAGGILFVVNLIAGRFAAWTQRWFYFAPPLLAAALVAAGGIIGTAEFLSG